MGEQSVRKKGGALGRALALSLCAALAVAAISALRSLYADARAHREVKEAVSNLKSLFISEKAWYAEHDAYSTDSGTIGFLPERGNRYSYFLAAEGPAQRRGEPDAPAPAPDAGVVAIGNDVVGSPGEEVLTVQQTGCTVTPMVDAAGRKHGVGVSPGGEFLGLAARMVEPASGGRPAVFDCWTIATVARSSPSQNYAAGEPVWETPDAWK